MAGAGSPSESLKGLLLREANSSQTPLTEVKQFIGQNYPEVGPIVSIKDAGAKDNETYKITTNTGENFYFRISKQDKAERGSIGDLFSTDSKQAVSDECAYILGLKRQGLSVASPLIPKNDSPVLNYKGRQAVLFTEAKGTISRPGYMTSLQQKQFGETLFRLSRANQALATDTKMDSRPSYDKKLLVGDPIKQISETKAEGIGDRHKESLQKSATLLATILSQEAEKGFCHGDQNGINHAIGLDGEMTLLDFDLFGGPDSFLLYDLGVAVAYPPEHIGEEIISGFEAERGTPLSNQEKSQVFALAATRHLLHASRLANSSNPPPSDFWDDVTAKIQIFAEKAKALNPQL